MALDHRFADTVMDTVPESPEATEVVLTFDIIDDAGIGENALVTILRRMEARGGLGRALYD